MKLVLAFLNELRKNNNREWFNDNRNLYEDAKKEVEDLINTLIPGIYSFDPDIGTLAAKRCVFRIFRDVRFSKDKSPYKTNFGGFISKGGRKGGYTGYYVHIEPGKSFLGGGIYMPPSDVLKKVRQEIFYNVEEYKKIITDNTFKNTFLHMEEDKLVRPPKDFPANFPDIEILKNKNYVVLHEVADDQIIIKSFEDHVINVFRVMHPFNSFINRAIN